MKTKDRIRHKRQNYVSRNSQTTDVEVGGPRSMEGISSGQEATS